MSKIRILLLTNRDSDNVGDQIIEATVISLLKGVMKNLGISEHGYVINSRAAGIISKKYMKTGDPELLEPARKVISNADVVVFGGAPLFNYAYQNFYLRTIKTIELAEEYGVPVLFSSIGVEPFDANNPKSLRLKEALASPCVRQITTRDDFDSLQKYVEGTDIPIAHVADPAVFSDIVFRKKQPELRLRTRVKRLAKAVLRRGQQPITGPVAAPTKNRKKIGLVVTRAGIFKDNGITFSESQQRKFWLSTRKLLTERGYDVRFFTTGHFSDEVFLDTLVKAKRIPASQAAVVVNTPEELIRELRACDGIIAYRLHASITSFALEIPSIGLTWNFKVPDFYTSVGYGERALDSERWTAEEVVEALEHALEGGVQKDEQFLVSVYDTLFSGMKQIFRPDSKRSPLTYEELKTALPPYEGTNRRQYEEKVHRKLRRTYETYQRYSAFYLKTKAATDLSGAK